MSVNVKTVFEALQYLISAKAIDSDSLTKSLSSKLSAYKEKAFKGLEEVLLAHHKPKLFSAERLDSNLTVYSQFCSEALSLLSVLESVLVTSCGEQMPSMNPNPGPVVMVSVADQTIVKSALEFVVCLGIYPYLLPGADAVLKIRMKQAAHVTKAMEAEQYFTNFNLYGVCSIVTKCLQNSVIGAPLTTKFLVDVLAALIQVTHAPGSEYHSMPGDKKSKSGQIGTNNASLPSDIAQHHQKLDCERTNEMSSQLLKQILERTYQPLLVQQLLMLQGPSSSSKKAGVPLARPAWFVKACGHLLSERLIARNGVINIISGVMDSVSDQSMPQAVVWEKCKAMARILATPPSSVLSLEHYYSTICPQILSLPRKIPASEEVLRVTTHAISLMLKRNKKLGIAHLIQPFLRPIEELASGDFTVNPSLEKNAQQCIDQLHKVINVTEPSSELLLSLFPYLNILFLLWRLVPKGKGHSIWCAQSKEIIGRVLSSATSADVLHFLCSVSGLPEDNNKFKFPEDTDSIRFKKKSDFEDIEASDDLVIELLQTTLHSRALSGQFFVKCLQCLCTVLSKDVESQNHKSIESVSRSSSSSDLLECERKMSKSQAELLNDAKILYITAALCENLYEEILKDLDVSAVLKACRTVFESHARVVASCDEIQMLPRQHKPLEITGGSVSLSMCCGLVSAFMSGSDVIITSDRRLFAALTDPLELIAAAYPDAKLRIIAEEIAICIATLGAVWSAEAKTCASEFKAGKKKMSKQIKNELSQLLKKEQMKDEDGNPKETVASSSAPSRYKEALKDFKDSMIPIRGHGLILLTKLIYARDDETLSNGFFLFDEFRLCLSHSDSYIYLGAINALVALALSTPQICCEKVLTTLCQEYANLSGQPNYFAGKQDDMDTEWYKTKVSSKSSTLKHDVEVRMKLGETLVKIYQELSEMLPHYSNDIIAALLTTVKDEEPLLQASSLSNIAEIFATRLPVFDTLLPEVLSCVDQVLKSDREPCVRQAALMVLKNVISGVSKIPERSEELLRIYRLLKSVEAAEQDELTRAHAQSALGELDTKMHDFIFPTESKLEKKITVLSNN